MTLSQIAARLSIAQYPEGMDRVYETIKEDLKPACDLQVIEKLQKDYDLFGQFYDDVVQTAKTINEDAALNLWVRTAVAYGKQCSLEQLKEIPVPAVQDSKALDYLPVQILIGLIPDSIAQYTKRGFSAGEIQSLLDSYKRSLGIMQRLQGRPGYNTVYFRWQSIFAKACIYETDGMQFELFRLPDSAVYLKNIQSGEIVAVFTEGLFHASAMQMVGSKGYEDDTDAFAVSFEEDAENYYGHRSLTQKADRVKSTFPKSQWTCLAKPGDDCLSIHIPSGADISPATMDRAIASARKILKERFPEHGSAMIYAASWLLDPVLDSFLKESSNILQFAHRFVRYPRKSDGTHAFNLIFQKHYDDYNLLPENSSLERGLKKLYLSGRYIYFYHGIIPE
ncbi:MAG: hypothetical protein J6Q92_03065 [Oscillospiraceae bacterium]|nr:hypothetical protein [Oscillospiraceae bacterium]